MWSIFFLCTIIGIASEINGNMKYDEGTISHKLPEGEYRAPSIYNEGSVRHELPEGKERAPSVYNYGKMVYSQGFDFGGEEISECLKLFGYKN